MSQFASRNFKRNDFTVDFGTTFVWRAHILDFTHYSNTCTKYFGNILEQQRQTVIRLQTRTIPITLKNLTQFTFLVRRRECCGKRFWTFIKFFLQPQSN